MWVVILLIIFLVVLFAILAINDNVKNKRISLIERWQTQFPNAFREKFGYITAKNQSGDVLREIAKTPELQLSQREDDIRKLKAEEERRRKEEEERKKKEAEQKRLAQLERARKIKEEKARKEKEINDKYDALLRQYPNGVESYKSLVADKTKESVINHQDDIIKYEQCYSEYQFYHSWWEKQNSFAKSIRNRDDEFPNWGCYPYSVKFNAKNRYDGQTTYQFKIWQYFCEAFCRDIALDYSLCPKYKEEFKSVDKMSKKQRHFKQHVYDKVVSFIKQTNNPTVILADSGFSKDATEYHFSYLKTQLEANEIDYYDYDEDIISLNDTFIVVEVISSNDRLVKLCSDILVKHKSFKPRITYITLLKEYSSQEMKSLIADEEKAIIERKRKEEADRKLKEQREKEETERKAKEERERKAKEEAQRLHTLSHTYKTSSSMVRSYLLDNGVRYFYHFTDRANLESIKKHGGLYSWSYCEEHNITIPSPGGDDGSRYLDIRHGLQDYVRLSFCDDHPMAWRLKQNGGNLVLLKIDPVVAQLRTTMFSDINAADGGHHHGSSIDDLKRVDIQATKEHYVSNTSPIFKKHQAEVLVKTFIPLEYIVNIDYPISI